MKSVIVTGCTGFIGRHTLESLCDEFSHVHAVFIKNKIQVNRENISWHEVNLLSEKQVDKFFEEVSATHLLHLAWYTEHGKYGYSELNLDWLSASLHLVKTFRESGGERVVCAGSCFEYNLDYGFLTENLTPLKPGLIYGQAKKSLYEMLMKYSEISGLSSAWGRVFYLYGPHEVPGRLVSSVINSLLDDKTAKCSAGKQKKDFLHVYDVADAFARLLNSNIQGAVNIGSGNAVSVKDIVLKIGELTGKTGLIEVGALPTRKNEKPLIHADIRKLSNELNWKPRFNLEEGLKHTINWWSDIKSNNT